MGLTLPRVLAAAVLLAALGRASSAYAAPTAADRETARTLMDQGRDLRDKGNLKEALKRFQAANDIMHVPTTALEVAKAQVALGLLVEARDTIAVLRTQPPGKTESDIFRQARAASEQLDEQLAGRVPSLIISLKGVDPTQEPALTLDGVKVPPALLGLPRTVDPGHHVVTAKTSSGTGTQEVDVKEGEQKPVEVVVVAIAPEPAVPPATSELPADEAPLPKRHLTPLTWAGIGAGGAGLLVGSITGGLSLSKKSTLKQECTNDVCGPSASSTLSSAKTLATVSDVGFVFAGAGAAVAVVSFVLSNRSSAAHLAPSASAIGVSVTPWISATGAGVTGTF